MSTTENEPEAAEVRFRVSPIAIRKLEINVAVLGEKIDQLLKDRSEVADLEDRLHALEWACPARSPLHRYSLQCRTSGSHHMIDYLLVHPTEAEAAAAPQLAAYRVGDAWDLSRIIPGVAVYRIAGTETVTDPETGATWERETREPLVGWFLVLALDDRDPALDASPACVLIADRDSGTILHTITTAEDLATLGIEPVFAGSGYPFGAPVLKS